MIYDARGHRIRKKRTPEGAREHRIDQAVVTFSLILARHKVTAEELNSALIAAGLAVKRELGGKFPE